MGSCSSTAASNEAAAYDPSSTNYKDDLENPLMTKPPVDLSHLLALNKQQQKEQLKEDLQENLGNAINQPLRNENVDPEEIKQEELVRSFLFLGTFETLECYCSHIINVM
jgi:hypothetical protein